MTDREWYAVTRLLLSLAGTPLWGPSAHSSYLVNLIEMKEEEEEEEEEEEND